MKLPHATVLPPYDCQSSIWLPVSVIACCVVNQPVAHPCELITYVVPVWISLNISCSGSDIMDHLLGQGASSMLSGLASTIPSGISQKISSYYQSMSSAPATDNEANSILNVSSGATMDSQGSQLPLSDTAGFRTGAPPNVSGVVFNLTQAATDVATVCSRK